MNRKEYIKQYYAEHRDEINARRRAWNAAHREKIKAQNRRYYVKHRQKKNENESNN